MPVARENRDRLIDLSITAPRDLMTPEGTLIVRAGQTVNPLDKLAFRLCLMVFDATKTAQIESVRRWSCRDQNARVLYLATQLPRQDGWDGLKTLGNHSEGAGVCADA